MKRFIATALAITLLIAVTAGSGALALSSGPPARTAAYQAYHNVLRAAVDEYGIGAIDSSTGGYSMEPEDHKGVVHAELIDFAGDGMPLLLLIYEDGTMYSIMFGSHFELYRYNGKAEMIYSGGIGAEGGYGSFVDVCPGKNGITYLHHIEYFAADGKIAEYYYTIENGQLSMALELGCDENYGGPQGYYYSNCFINGQPASEQAYKDAPRNHLGITEEREVPENNSGAIVHRTLAELQSPQTTPKEAADVLYSLDLFKGTGTKPDGSPEYSLGGVPTRGQAIVMLVRFLGAEQEAQANAYSHPFTDVPDWADAHVGYAYKNNLTNGMTATTFGTDVAAQPIMYLTFVLRALGYTDSGANPDFTYIGSLNYAKSVGLTYHDYQGGFLRSDLAMISFTALSRPLKGSDVTLIKELVANGAVDAAKAAAAGFGT